MCVTKISFVSDSEVEKLKKVVESLMTTNTEKVNICFSFSLISK